MAGQAFNIKINEDDLRKVKQTFAEMEKIGVRVMVRALNKTLSGVKTDSSAAIREVVTAKKAAVDETFKISRATDANLSARIASTGKPVALVNFSTRETQKGVSVQVRKDRPRKVIPDTFKAKMKSGHEGVFWREWHGQKTAKTKHSQSIAMAGYIWSERQNCYIPAAWLKKEYRFEIKERFGPRVPDIMGNEPVMKDILAKAGDRLHNNLQHETDYEFDKLKG